MKEAAIPAHDTETSTSSWDGPAVVAAIADTATEADLKSVFAWQDDEGDAAAKASYKFPHHDGVNGPANMAACSAGIAVLNGGRGGADIPQQDRPGVWEHLSKHLEDGGAEEVPPLAEGGGDQEKAAPPEVAEIKSHLDAALKLLDALAGAPKEPPAGQGPGGEEELPTERFDPRSKASLESLAAAMIADADFAYQVQRVATGLIGREVIGDCVALTERAVADDGTAMLRVIAPGWGSSGYYSPEVLERDGPKVFRAGTQMFWNHQTDAEEEARPEGDLRDLAGELIEDARWEAHGPEGPGLYARTKVFTAFRDAVDELAPHIGVSIRAMGKATQGQAEGREGPIVDALTHGRSIDFVTAPGAGGKVLSLFEAARRKGELNMADQKELIEAKEAAQKAQAELAKRDAADIVRDALRNAKLPEAARKRLGELKPALGDDGSLDADAWRKTVDEAVASEVAYLAEVTGAGSIRHLGGGSADDEVKNEQALVEAFQAIGLPESTAKIAAAGRK